MNLLDMFEGREPHQQAIDKLEKARIDHLKEKMDYYAKHGMAEQFKAAKEEHDSYFKVADECMGYSSLGEAGIPGNVPADKIPGKEDLLKGRGRSYYESVEEGNPSKKVFKDKAGKPVGEIGIDPDSSPGNSEWYVYHYGTGYSVVGFDSAAEAKRELMYVHKHPEAVEGHESTFNEAGIPGNVPTEKIPGKEDLLKGKGRSYYEAQDQKKNSEVTDPAAERLLTKARREFPNARSDAEALAMKILSKEQDDVSRLDQVNDREDRMIDKLIDIEQKLQRQIDQLTSTEELSEGQRLNIGDPVIVTAPNEFEGKTGEIVELSPSGKFVIVNLYNHGEQPMHLSDVEFNQYAADQEDEDDWYDDGAEDTMEGAQDLTPHEAGHADGLSNEPYENPYPEASTDHAEFRKGYRAGLAEKDLDEGWQDFNKKEPYEVCLAGKPVKTFDYYQDARRFHDNWKKKLYNQGEKEKADKITLNPIMKEQGVAEAETDYQKRRQRERDIDAGKPVAKQRTSKMTDYQKRRAQDKKDMELGEDAGGNYKQMNYPNDPTDPFVVYDRTLKAIILTTKSLDEAKQEAIEWAEYDDIDVSVINRATKKSIFRVNGYAGAEKYLNEEQDTSGVESAIIRRIMVAHTDLLKQFGPQKVMQAAEEVAYNVGDVDEIGTSDVSAYVQQVKQILGAE